jgi:phosphonatase-like hydrolase
MIELVVFDLAGTTVADGGEINAAFRDTLAAHGIAASPAAVDAVMGLPKDEAVRTLLADAGRDVTAEQVTVLHAEFVRRMREHYADSPTLAEIPGAAAAFAALRAAGVKVALNSGFSRSIAEVILTRLGWTAPAVIDADVTSDEVPRGRPHPDMIWRLMTQLGVTDPKRVAKVGDTRADLEEGAAAGCGLNVGVTTGAYTREQLSKYPHTHLVGSVADVPGLILPAGG